MSTPEGQIDFYWRPGCPFCMSLERSLSKMNVPLNKKNIWESPADAAYVRSVAGGNETVPTVTIGGTSMVNPSAKQVAAMVASEFPGLLPESNSPSKGLLNKLRRT